MRKWLPGVLIAITFIVSALMLPRLPAVVTLDLGLLLPFEVEGESGPRAVFAFGTPALALAVWLFFLWASSPAGLVAQKRVFGRWAPRRLSSLDRSRVSGRLTTWWWRSSLLSFWSFT